MPHSSAVLDLYSTPFNCPVGVAINDVVYLSSADSVDKADADDLAKMPAIGIVVQKPTTTTCIVQLAGENGNFSGLTPGATYYVGIISGTIVTPAPSAPNVQVLGIARDATILIMMSSGAGGSGPSSGAVTKVLFVDVRGPAVGADGSLQRPYPTIQSAINAIPAATTAAESKATWVVVIAPGDYDEDLAINITHRRIVLASWGPWNLGTFDAVDWGPSGTRRNISISSTAGAINGIRNGLVIGAVFGQGWTEGLTTHESYLGRCRISGKIIAGNAWASPSNEIVVIAEVFGDGTTSIDFTLAAPNACQFYTYKSRYRGKVEGSNCLLLQEVQATRFDGDVHVSQYSRIQDSRINANFQTDSAANAGIFPEGFINCHMTAAKTFTGPAGSFRLDGNTNYWVKTGAVVLAGGATKVIQDDNTP